MSKISQLAFIPSLDQIKIPRQVQSSLMANPNAIAKPSTNRPPVAQHESVGTKILHAIEHPINTAKQGVSSVGHSISNAEHKLESGISTAAHKVGGGISTAAHKVGGGISSVAHKAEDVAKSAVHGISEAAEKAKEAIEEPFKKIAEVVLIGGGLLLLVLYLNKEQIGNAAGKAIEYGSKGAAAGAKLAI